MSESAKNGCKARGEGFDRLLMTDGNDETKMLVRKLSLVDQGIDSVISHTFTRESGGFYAVDEFARRGGTRTNIFANQGQDLALGHLT